MSGDTFGSFLLGIAFALNHVVYLSVYDILS
jgi:hypothetical protein